MPRKKKTDEPVEIFDNSQIIEDLGENQQLIIPGDKNAVQALDVSDASEDSEFAKENIKGLIEIGAQHLEHLGVLAKEDEKSRTYEVLFNAMKTLTDMNKQILEIEKAKKDIEKQDEPKEGNKTVNNENVFIGTTNDLLDQILKGKKDE